MPLYTVLAPPVREGEAASDPVRFVFVKDGFCWPAFFVPELWLLYRRLWLVFLVYVAAGLGLTWAAAEFGGPLPWAALALVHIYLGLEGNEMRRRRLMRRGYTLTGVVEGRRSEVEIRFFADWLPPVAAPPAVTPPPASAGSLPARASAEAGEVVGLFPAPGGAS